jgi:hypothetical protein
MLMVAIRNSLAKVIPTRGAMTSQDSGLDIKKLPPADSHGSAGGTTTAENSVDPHWRLGVGPSGNAKIAKMTEAEFLLLGLLSQVEKSNCNQMYADLTDRLDRLGGGKPRFALLTVYRAAGKFINLGLVEVVADEPMESSSPLTVTLRVTPAGAVALQSELERRRLLEQIVLGSLECAARPG